MSQGLKIGDILGYRNEIEQTLNKIKEVIEFEYPLGNEIYRDSTGIYFSCPNVNDINKLRSEIIDQIKNINKLDFSLQIEISDKSSRSMVILASEREKSLDIISYPHAGDVEHISKESENTDRVDICPVCRIRLKAEKEDRCKKCKEKYEKRSKAWIEEGNNHKETIWLDEVADKNDRVALIVGQFDLRRWLSGEFVNTFVSQTFDEWKDICVDRGCTEKVSDVCSRLNISNILDLERGFLDLFKNTTSLNDDWKKICGSFIGIKPNDFIRDFWEPIAERDATGKAQTLTDNSEKAKHLIRLLFRKHPSPARIYRIWETTTEFINNIIFEKVLKEYNWNSEIRGQRIQFKIEPNPEIPEGSTCDIDFGFSPVCVDKGRGIFVSTVNLEILKKFGNTIEEIIKNITNREIKIKTDDDKRWRKAKIIDTKLAQDKFQNYLPYIKIYDFPDQFMILVPAYDAFEIAKRIYSEYELQFSKVRDRLPFHLGIIAFHRRTPLYVAMDAGKRLLNAFRHKTETKEATIKSIEDYSDDKFGGFVKKIQISEIPEYSSVPSTWFISYSTGDPEQEDEWHPYFRFAGNDSATDKEGYSFDYTGEKNYVVHVKKLNCNDKILIETSYFKMLFLESSSDRFRIDEDLRPIDEIRRLDDLWKDIQKIMKEKNLGITQLYAYWQEVEERKREYQNSTVKENFIKAAITNIFKISQIKEKELFDKLYQATIDGLLNLCLYWNLQIRKIKPGR